MYGDSGSARYNYECRRVARRSLLPPPRRARGECSSSRGRMVTAWLDHASRAEPAGRHQRAMVMPCHKVILDGEDDRLGHLVGLSGPWDGVSSRRARESCGALPIFGAEYGSRNYSRRVTLMRRGASSRATDRAICSTAAPTKATATCPGFGLRAGVPLTSTIAPVGVRCGAARRWHIPRACRSCRGSHQGPS